VNHPLLVVLVFQQALPVLMSPLLFPVAAEEADDGVEFLVVVAVVGEGLRGEGLARALALAARARGERRTLVNVRQLQKQRV